MDHESLLVSTKRCLLVDTAEIMQTTCHVSRVPCHLSRYFTHTHTNITKYEGTLTASQLHRRGVIERDQWESRGSEQAKHEILPAMQDMLVST